MFSHTIAQQFIPHPALNFLPHHTLSQRTQIAATFKLSFHLTEHDSSEVTRLTFIQKVYGSNLNEVLGLPKVFAVVMFFRRILEQWLETTSASPRTPILQFHFTIYWTLTPIIHTSSLSNVWTIPFACSVAPEPPTFYKPDDCIRNYEWNTEKKLEISQHCSHMYTYTIMLLDVKQKTKRGLGIQTLLFLRSAG